MKNIGNIDRVARLIIGGAIIATGIYFNSWLGVIGAVPIATALMGWCPLYMPFGIKTCRS